MSETPEQAMLRLKKKARYKRIHKKGYEIMEEKVKEVDKEYMIELPKFLRSLAIYVENYDMTRICSGDRVCESVGMDLKINMGTFQETYIAKTDLIRKEHYLIEKKSYLVPIEEEII